MGPGASVDGFVEEKNLLPLLGLEPCTVQSVDDAITPKQLNK